MADDTVIRTSKERCFHSELRRDRHDETDAYLDVWYCPEPQCDFEVNLCKHNNQRQGEHGLPYCADCGAQVPESLRPAPETNAGYSQAHADQMRTALETLLPGLVLDLRYADDDDDKDAMRSRIETVTQALLPPPAQKAELGDSFPEKNGG